MFFRGLRGSGHPSCSHLDHKVAPKRGQDSQNDIENGRQRCQSGRSVRSCCRSYGNGARLKSGQRSKSILGTSPIVRSSFYSPPPEIPMFDVFCYLGSVLEPWELGFRCMFYGKVPLGVFFEQISIDFELRELVWMTFGL